MQLLIETWLAAKAKVLAGEENSNLIKVARPTLVKIVQDQREKDKALGQRQIIYAGINSIEIEEQTDKRIAIKKLPKLISILEFKKKF